jgi:HPt (histidine-containing phosphotransfer) domain-containing protein
MGTTPAAAAAVTTMKEDVLAPEVFGCLQQAMAQDSEGLVELCRDYLADARRTLECLHKDLLHRDAEQLCVHAHYLKGSSQVMGTKAVAQCCITIEGAARSGDFVSVKKLLSSARVAIDAAQAEMAARLGAPIVPIDKPAA